MADNKLYGGRGEVVTLLSAVATGTSESVRINGGWSNYTWTTVTTGSPTTTDIDIELSLDDVTWGVSDTSTTNAGEMRHVTNESGVYIRAKIITLTGGTTPKVTVKLMMHDR